MNAAYASDAGRRRHTLGCLQARMSGPSERGARPRQPPCHSGPFAASWAHLSTLAAGRSGVRESLVPVSERLNEQMHGHSVHVPSKQLNAGCRGRGSGAPGSVRRRGRMVVRTMCERFARGAGTPGNSGDAGTEATRWTSDDAARHDTLGTRGELNGPVGDLPRCVSSKDPTVAADERGGPPRQTVWQPRGMSGGAGGTAELLVLLDQEKPRWMPWKRRLYRAQPDEYAISIITTPRGTFQQRAQLSRRPKRCRAA